MSKRPPPQNEETFHKARSHLIDAFAGLEARIVTSLYKAGKPIKNDTLAAKLRTLRGIPSVSKTDVQALDRLAELTQFRADIVHGTLEIVDIDGERMACFRNARYAADKIQSASLITYKHLKDMTEEIVTLSSVISR